MLLHADARRGLSWQHRTDHHAFDRDEMPSARAWSSEMSDICTPSQPQANFSPFTRRGRIRLITLIGVAKPMLPRSEAMVIMPIDMSLAV